MVQLVSGDEGGRQEPGANSVNNLFVNKLYPAEKFSLIQSCMFVRSYTSIIIKLNIWLSVCLSQKCLPRIGI